jgi:hypothetical protein
VLERRPPTYLEPLLFRGLREREADRLGSLLDDGRDVWSAYVKENWVDQRRRWRHRAGDDMVLWNCVLSELWRRRSCAPSVDNELTTAMVHEG